MILLAIDSSTKSTGLALYDGIHVLYECVWESRDHHSVDLAPGIEQAFRQTGIAVNELKAIGVAIGPGSYTGLRIALSISKGLAFALNLALVAVPTLDVLAAAQPVQDLPMVCVLQAGRGRLAIGWYEVKKGGWVSKGSVQSVTAQQLSEEINKPTIICGELEEIDRAAIGRKYKNAQLSSPAWGVRRPAILAELAWARWQAGEIDKLGGLAPIYLQSGVAVPL